MHIKNHQSYLLIFSKVGEEFSGIARFKETQSTYLLMQEIKFIDNKTKTTFPATYREGCQRKIITSLTDMTSPTLFFQERIWEEERWEQKSLLGVKNREKPFNTHTKALSGTSKRRFDTTEHASRLYPELIYVLRKGVRRSSMQGNPKDFTPDFQKLQLKAMPQLLEFTS